MQYRKEKDEMTVRSPHFNFFVTDNQSKFLVYALALFPTLENSNNKLSFLYSMHEDACKKNSLLLINKHTIIYLLFKHTIHALYFEKHASKIKNARNVWLG